MLTVALLLASLLAPQGAHAISLSWKPVTTLANGKPLTGPVYYFVYRDVSGTVKYSRLTPMPITCTTFYDSTVIAGTSYDYEVTAWTPANGESAPSNKSGNVIAK